MTDADRGSAALSYADDTPAEPAKFEFDLVAAALTRVLVTPSGSAVVLGLHGPWGSGKTTLMHALRDQIAKGMVSGDPILIEFNAWKYQDRAALWRALILRVLGELRRWAAPEDRPALDELEQSLYRTFAVRQDGPWSVNWRTVIVEAVSISLSAVHLGIVGRLLRAAGIGSGRGGRKRGDDSELVSREDVEKLGGVLERAVIERQVAQVQSVEQFLAKFAELVGKLTAGGRRVFVLVDDLDRCLPEAALEIFESIKLFMDAPGCGFVVAVDREVIRRGLLVRYADLRGAAQPPFISADEYLEKTISISYDVPRLSESDVDVLIDAASLPFRLEPQHRALIRSGLGANPRRVKRFMNLLAVQAELARLARERDLTVPPALYGQDAGELGILLKLMLISYRYPGIFQAALADPGLLTRLQQIGNSASARPESEAAQMRADRRKDLVAEPMVVLATSVEDEFWALIAHKPNLVPNQEAAHRLMTWFRCMSPQAYVTSR
jgi:hypothetical protein